MKILFVVTVLCIFTSSIAGDFDTLKKSAVEKVLTGFLEGKQSYQITIANLLGAEMLKVESGEKRTLSWPNGLSNREIHRGLFKEAVALEKEQIALSPIYSATEKEGTNTKHVLTGQNVLRETIDKYHLTESFLEMGMNICAYHHEKFNGKGYPEGLVGEEIPLEARIFALCDAYDAIRSKRSYKEAIPHLEAMNRIVADKNQHFDPDVVEAFLKCEKNSDDHLRRGSFCRMNKLWLLIAMVITGIIYAVVILYSMAMPLFNNLVLHCIVQGTLFGLMNFAVAVLFYKRLEKLKRLNKQLKFSLMTDKLTGLLNRRAFDEDIENIDKPDKLGSYSLIFLDIDNFRDFNNHFGHDIGDNVLRKVGETIQACARATDRVYRYGGEEIILLLLDCDKRNAMRMAEKIRLEISQLDNQAYPQITVSLGVSSYPDDGRYIQDVIVSSDKALLNAKQSGKNCTISC